MVNTGTLVCDRIDLNSREIVEKLLSLLKMIARDGNNYRKITVSGTYYFRLDRQASESQGWYLIFVSDTPLYVGEANNLNNRLNSNDGSRDNFANPKRKSDSERNFLKRFIVTGYLTDPKVLLIEEGAVCKAFGAEYPLSSIDHTNIEKFLGIFRHNILGKEPRTN